MGRFFRTTVTLQLEETPSKTPRAHWPRLQSVNSSVKSSSLLFSPLEEKKQYNVTCTLKIMILKGKQEGGKKKKFSLQSLFVSPDLFRIYLFPRQGLSLSVCMSGKVGTQTGLPENEGG